MEDVTGLFGLRILVTREAEKAAETARAIEARGGIALVFPTIKTAPPQDPEPLRNAVRALASFDWVAFTSRTAVAAFVRECEEIGLPLCWLGGPRFAAVGQGTARALFDIGVQDVLVPDRGQEDAEGLARALTNICPSDARVLILRAEKGRDVAGSLLRQQGLRVSEVVAYRTIPRRVTQGEVKALLDGPRPDAALFFSPSAFHAFLHALGEDRARAFLSPSILCAIGRTTAEAMTKAGHSPQTVADSPSDEAALAALARALARR